MNDDQKLKNNQNGNGGSGKGRATSALKSPGTWFAIAAAFFAGMLLCNLIG